jgi:hypothetical protein
MRSGRRDRPDDPLPKEPCNAKETKADKDALPATALNVTVAQLRAAFATVHGSTDGKCKPRPASSGSGAGSYPTDQAA